MAVNTYSELTSAEVPDSWQSSLPRPSIARLPGASMPPPAPPASAPNPQAMTHLAQAAAPVPPPPRQPASPSQLKLTLPPPASTPAPRPMPMSAPTSFVVPKAAPPAAAPPKRRWLGGLAVVLTIAVIGVGGAVYGPHLLDRLTDVADAPATANEPTTAPAPSMPTGAAILPVATTAPGPVRTITAQLTGGAYGTDPSTVVELTTDFDTGLARVALTRADGSSLEVLTYGDSAFLRRSGAPLWYHTSGGTLLADLRLDRASWLMTLDQVLPDEVRRTAVVNGSAAEDLAGVPVTHVAVTIDVAALRIAEPALAAAWTERFGVAPTTTTMDVHLWIDDGGLVRQSHGLLGQGIQSTIVSTAADAWAPTYPDVTQWRELDARSVLDLDA
jgi:hypothetical protein